MQSLLGRRSSLIVRWRTTSGCYRVLNNGSSRRGDDDHWDSSRVDAWVGHSFPDFIEFWNRDTFRTVGYGLGVSTAVVALTTVPFASGVLDVVPVAVLSLGTAAYWRIGLKDIQQKEHAIRRNYPVLGNLRYVLETVRLVTVDWFSLLTNYT